MPGYLRPRALDDGRWEAEDLVDTARASRGTLTDVGMEFWGDMFSHQYALQWEGGKEDDTLTIPFLVADPRSYEITLRPCRTEAGGTFRIALDDRPPSDPINLYQPPPFPGLFDFKLADARLAEGEHTLTFTSMTPDPSAKGQRLLLDNFKVTRAEPTDTRPESQEDPQP
jgi:hypothetical protein